MFFFVFFYLKKRRRFLQGIKRCYECLLSKTCFKLFWDNCRLVVLCHLLEKFNTFFKCWPGSTFLCFRLSVKDLVSHCVFKSLTLHTNLPPYIFFKYLAIRTQVLCIFEEFGYPLHNPCVFFLLFGEFSEYISVWINRKHILLKNIISP